MNEPHLLKAFSLMPADYRPRTTHFDDDGRPTYINRLITETSPYLLQHAHNPVDWRPYGDAAFEEAIARNVPIFLSVGYSTCHWCHVMERESFEDTEIAEFLNGHFVAMKLDREERPDVDACFMDVVQTMTGHGGWPMSVFMTPDRAPIFAGTYFPARDGDRGPHRGFLTLIVAIAKQWRDPRIAEQGHALLAELRQRAASPPGERLPDVTALAAGADAFLKNFDAMWGGFGSAPKFPRPCTLDFLLREHLRTRDVRLLEAVERTLERMYCGGLYDHVVGGFTRYSTDRQWLVPHFEKMLYDNAQLVSTYLDAYQVTGRALYAHVVRDVLTYLERDMSAPKGGFYSATDADSEGEEGRFYVFTVKELDELLPAEDARFMKETFDVTAHGNFEHANILNLRQPLSAPDLQRFEGLRDTLRQARSRREQPGLDDKILTSWNALTISAFARAGQALGERRWIERAVRAFDFVWSRLRDDGRLLRAARGDRAQHMGVLEDYAGLTLACLDLLTATSDPRFLDAALELQAAQDRHFWDEASGGYFRGAHDAPPLPIREKPEYDGAEPSGNALAALALLRLSDVTGVIAHRARAEQTVRAFDAIIRRAPVAVPKLLCALDGLHAEPVLVVVVGDDERQVEALVRASTSVFAPHVTLLCDRVDGPLARRLAVFQGRAGVNHQAAAYVCVGTHCELPITAPEALARRLAVQP